MKKQCKEVQNEFFNAYYEQMDKDKKSVFTDHIGNCAQCAEKFTAFRSMLDNMKQYRRPEPGEEFWDMYWEDLKPRLNKKRFSLLLWLKENFIPLFIQDHPVYAYAATAVVFLVIGIFITRLFLQQPVIQQQTYSSVKQAAIRQNAEHHIQQAKVILLGIMNTDNDQPIWDEQIRASNQLLKETGSIKKQLDPTAQLQLLTLISELEVLLMQIANIDSEYDLGAVELVRSSIKHQGILFKINLNEILETYESGQSGEKTMNINKKI